MLKYGICCLLNIMFWHHVMFSAVYYLSHNSKWKRRKSERKRIRDKQNHTTAEQC